MRCWCFGVRGWGQEATPLRLQTPCRPLTLVVRYHGGLNNWNGGFGVILLYSYNWKTILILTTRPRLNLSGLGAGPDLCVEPRILGSIRETPLNGTLLNPILLAL